MAKRRGQVAGTLVLDAQGLVKLAAGDPETRALARKAQQGGQVIVTAASTLAEVLRGVPEDAPLHQALRHVAVAEIGKDLGRKAGELLGATQLAGGQHTVDALLAAVALAQRRPAVLLTSNPDDMARLTEEPGRTRSRRIAVVGI